jgi:hypothetical protein
MEISIYPVKFSTDYSKIRYGSILPICISLFPFSGKLNKHQRTPLAILCTLLWSTPFPIILYILQCVYLYFDYEKFSERNPTAQHYMFCLVISTFLFPFSFDVCKILKLGQNSL